MTLEEIYSNLFKVEDNNNNYIDMPSSQLNKIQLTEPTLSVSEFVVKGNKKKVSRAIPERTSFRIPLISINDIQIDQIKINAFTLDYSSFIPTIQFEFSDIDNKMLSTNVLKDGSIIKVYIGGYGDELYYKPIRQDFIVTNIKKTKGVLQNKGGIFSYKITGNLNVPVGYKKESWSNNEVTSIEELFNLSIQTGLGFATNFPNKTNDSMKWENIVGTNYFDFMNDITRHACYSPNTFFTSYIDQFYVLNFIECHRLLSHGGLKTDTPAMIYSAHQQNKEPKKITSENKEYYNEKTREQLVLNDEDNDMYNFSQKVSYYTISNNDKWNGWTNYIEEYYEINEGYSSISDGYKRHVNYSDVNANDWGTNIEFVIPPIDNLFRDNNGEIQDLPEECDENTYVPVNLMQMNNDEYLDDDVNGADDMSEIESFVYHGQVDTSNTYKLFYFAESQNEYQMKCLKKCGLKVTLQNFNPAITKFSRIWVDIYDKNRISNNEINPKSPTNQNVVAKEIYEIKKENIISFPNEGETDSATSIKTNTSYPRSKYNRMLSGWYVVTEIKYNFDNKEKRLKTILILNRIEERPLYKNDYNRTKNAIKKYKKFVSPENFFTNKSDISYSNMSDGMYMVNEGNTNSTSGGNTNSTETINSETIVSNDELENIKKNGTIDSSVVTNFIPLQTHIYKLKASRVPKYLVIHYTAGASSKPGSAQGMYSTFNERESSADFCVDDRDICQFNPDIENYACWSVGDKLQGKTGGKLHNICSNLNSVSIEICSNLKSGTSYSDPNHSGWTFTSETLNNAIKLAKVIMKKYKIPKENVIRHYDVTGKLCPGILGWNLGNITNEISGASTATLNDEKIWNEFKSKL